MPVAQDPSPGRPRQEHTRNPRGGPLDDGGGVPSDGGDVTLNIRSGIERICVDVMDTPAPLMTIVRPGEHVSLLRGATALVLLAYANEAEIDDIIARTPGSGAVDVVELKAALAKIRRQGFACTTGRRIPGVTAISVPIFDINNEVHYSIAITGPSIRMDNRLKEFKRILIDAGRSISALVGASFPILSLDAHKHVVRMEDPPKRRRDRRNGMTARRKLVPARSSS